MVFIAYFLANLVVFVFFFKFQKKHIHSLEILVLWLISGILFQNYSAFFYMNLKWLIIPNVLNLKMTHFLNRIVLIPLLTIIFYNQYIVRKKVSQKSFWVFSFVLLMAGLEMLADFLGVLKHVHWNFWWSFMFWLFFILFSTFVMTFFRKKLAKEVGQN